MQENKFSVDNEDASVEIYVEAFYKDQLLREFFIRKLPITSPKLNGNLNTRTLNQPVSIGLKTGLWISLDYGLVHGQDVFDVSRRYGGLSLHYVDYLCELHDQATILVMPGKPEVFHVYADEIFYGELSYKIKGSMQSIRLERMDWQH